MNATPAHLQVLITQFAPLRATLSLAYAVSPDRPVVIRGEVGTGKSLLAHVMRGRARVARTIVEINDVEERPRWAGALFIELPPLRKRVVDIALLADHFARHAPGRVHLTQDAVARLVDYCWPGNVSELRCVIDRTVRRANAPLIRADAVRLWF